MKCMKLNRRQTITCSSFLAKQNRARRRRWINGKTSIIPITFRLFNWSRKITFWCKSRNKQGNCWGTVSSFFSQNETILMSQEPSNVLITAKFIKLTNKKCETPQPGHICQNTRDVVDLRDGSELSDEDRKENRNSMDNRRINYFLPFS